MDEDALTLLDEVTHRPRWHARAACAGKGPDTFFPARGGSTAAARALCAVCPVRQQCLQTALDDAATLGVWAGTTERERRVLRRQRVA